MSINLLHNPRWNIWSCGQHFPFDNLGRVQRITSASYGADNWIVLSDHPGYGNSVVDLDYKDGVPGNHSCQMITARSNKKFGFMQIIDHCQSWSARREGLGNDLSWSVDLMSSTTMTVKLAVLGWYVNDKVDLPTRNPIASWNADGVDPTLADGWNYRIGPTSFTVSSTMDRNGITGYVGGGTGFGGPNDYNLAVIAWTDNAPTSGDQLISAKAAFRSGIANYDNGDDEYDYGSDVLACRRFYWNTYDERQYPGYPTSENAIFMTAPTADAGLWIPCRTPLFYLKTPSALVFNPTIDGTAGAVSCINNVRNMAGSNIPVTIEHVGLSGFSVRPTNAGGWFAGDTLCFHAMMYSRVA